VIFDCCGAMWAPLPSPSSPRCLRGYPWLEYSLCWALSPRSYTAWSDAGSGQGRLWSGALLTAIAVIEDSLNHVCLPRVVFLLGAFCDYRGTQRVDETWTLQRNAEDVREASRHFIGLRIGSCSSGA